jgi:DNA polymerase-4/DNA polymerase V
LENAVAKMRRFHLATNRVVITLRSQRFEDTSIEIKLPRHTTSVLELVHPVKNHFDPLFKSQTLYRATGVVLCELKEAAKIQLTLFENPNQIVKSERVSAVIDEINKNFGSRCIHVADSVASSPIKNYRLIY